MDYTDSDDDRIQEAYDPYDSMPFGDAIRFEENQVFADLALERLENEDDYFAEDDSALPDDNGPPWGEN